MDGSKEGGGEREGLREGSQKRGRKDERKKLGLKEYVEGKTYILPQYIGLEGNKDRRTSKNFKKLGHGE